MTAPAVTRRAHAEPALPRAAPRLLGVGSTLPARRASQSELCEEIGSLLELSGAELARWQRICRGSGVDFRHAVAPLAQVIRSSTAERMRLFDASAPELAAGAARQALVDAGVEAHEVTDLVVVTCTGFSAPGVPRRLIDLLALRPSVRSSQVGFMGCFGGICGLRAAAAHASAERGAVVLLVSVELCSLHLRADRDPQNLVASALFSDGAAAAVIVDGEVCTGGTADRRQGRSAPASLLPGRSHTVAGTLDAMGWTITDMGFAMTLAREVPDRLREVLPDLVESAREVLIHPGGPSIIDAAADSLRPEQRGATEVSRAILREMGNMSSASILFVLERWRRQGGVAPASLVAFGPGLTIDSVMLVDGLTHP
ncbi:MAG: type III polyketide synthase [Phycisphaeraceae bacterium]|nr:type III polyketide synthase [Phycisphaeraceae bacterium]